MRKCNNCSIQPSQVSDIFFDVAYSNNGDWYPEYSVLVLCKNCFIQWFPNNLEKTIVVQRILNPVEG